MVEQFTETTPEELREYILDSLADTMATDINDLEKELIRNGGDMNIKSLHAVCVIADLEEIFDTTLVSKKEEVFLGKATLQTLVDHCLQKLNLLVNA